MWFGVKPYKNRLKILAYSGNEYFDRSFSPSIVVIKSIICPEAVWNST